MAAAETLHADIAAALDRLAAHGTTDEIAEHLEQLGVTGRPGRCHECILAAYLKAEVGDLKSVTIDANDLVFFETEDEPDARAPIPGRLTQFADQFDDGRYPALIAPGRD